MRHAGCLKQSIEKNNLKLFKFKLFDHFSTDDFSFSQDKVSAFLGDNALTYMFGCHCVTVTLELFFEIIQ